MNTPPDSEEFKTYKFSTFQELVDRVPSDRIMTCMTEMAQGFSQGKLFAEMAIEVAKLQSDNIIDLPKSIIKIPDTIRWMDDGKGEITTRLKVGKDADDEVKITTVMAKEASDDKKREKADELAREMKASQ